MRQLTDEQEYAEYAQLLKAFEMTIAVLKEYRAIEEPVAQSDSFAAVFDAQLRFGRMVPRVVSPFPDWLHRERHSLKVARARSNEAFWRVISEDTLVSSGYPAQICVESQATLIEEYILRNTRGHADMPVELISDLCTTAPHGALDKRITTALCVVLCVVSGGRKRFEILCLVRHRPLRPMRWRSRSVPS